MKLFICQPCNHSTDSKSNYNKHIRTIKHINILNKIDKKTLNILYNGIFYNNESVVKNPNKNASFDLIKNITKNEIVNYLQNKIVNENYCYECNKSFSYVRSYRRHMKTKHNIYNFNMNDEEDDEDDDYEDEDIKIISNKINKIKKINKNSNNIANNSHNTNKQTYMNSNNVDNSHYKTINNVSVAGDYNQNNMKINITYLNQNFSQMIPIQTFIDGIQDKYRLTLDDANRLLKSRDAGIRFFKKEFSKLIKEKCKDQIRDLGIDLPSDMFPIITTDTNLRTHNEKTNSGWQRTGKTDRLEKIYHIYNDQIYQLTNRYIFLDDKSLIELYNFIRRDNFIFSDNLKAYEHDNEKDTQSIDITEALKKQILFEEKKKEFERLTGRPFIMLPLD